MLTKDQLDNIGAILLGAMLFIAIEIILVAAAIYGTTH